MNAIACLHCCKLRDVLRLEVRNYCQRVAFNRFSLLELTNLNLKQKTKYPIGEFA